MNSSTSSLRSVIEKWLSPSPAMPIRVAEFSRTRSNRRRYVRVEVVGPTGRLALFFFRHDDGAWCVFPGEGQRPVMGGSGLVAHSVVDIQ
ncbi:hypothetical protein CA602_51850 [Paraburkholderia hospita]|nr:hypothetical protein [Paraburkholderia hospita]OUL68200.1 hypothetical protein CA602_51850 [Paraburkholderia hospita]